VAKKVLSKELEKQEPEELLRLLNEISKRFPVAKMYLTMEFGFDGIVIIEKYKKLIEKEYFPSRGHGKARSSKVTKILKEFNQIAAFREDVLDMQLYQIERAVVYYQAYRHEYEPFINNLIKNWSAFLSAASKEGFLFQYQERIEKMFTDRFKKFWLQKEMEDRYLNPIPLEVENETD